MCWEIPNPKTPSPHTTDIRTSINPGHQYCFPLVLQRMVRNLEMKNALYIDYLPVEAILEPSLCSPQLTQVLKVLG